MALHGVTGAECGNLLSSCKSAQICSREFRHERNGKQDCHSAKRSRKTQDGKINEEVYEPDKQRSVTQERASNRAPIHLLTMNINGIPTTMLEYGALNSACAL